MLKKILAFTLLFIGVLSALLLPNPAFRCKVFAQCPPMIYGDVYVTRCSPPMYNEDNELYCVEYTDVQDLPCNEDCYASKEVISCSWANGCQKVPQTKSIPCGSGPSAPSEPPPPPPPPPPDVDIAQNISTSFFWNSKDIDRNVKLPEFTVRVKEFTEGTLYINVFAPSFTPDNNAQKKANANNFFLYTIPSSSPLLVNKGGDTREFVVNAVNMASLEPGCQSKKLSSCINGDPCFGTTLGRCYAGKFERPSQAIGTWHAYIWYEGETGTSDLEEISWNVISTIIHEN